MHSSSLDKMREFKIKYLEQFDQKPLSILDIGSQDINGTYKEIFDNPNWKYMGADITNGKNVDIVLKDMYDWKEVESNCYDVVVTGQTFEHVEYFWITILEITRILKQGGICCIIAPSGGFEHRYPTDCWRFYPDGFKALCKFAGLLDMEVYTQWKPQNYEDGSDLWQDSVLICQKPRLSFVGAILFSIKNHIIKKACKLAAR